MSFLPSLFENIGDQLRQARRESGLSVVDLSIRANVAMPTIYKAESTGRLSVISLASLANAMGRVVHIELIDPDVELISELKDQS